MWDVLLATVPGVLVLTGYFGPGTLVNILFGGLIAVACEYVVTLWRGRDPMLAISDLSILVTSTLLCIALPPYSPWVADHHWCPHSRATGETSVWRTGL